MNKNSTPKPSSKRKRGGQPGNKNSFRHGFYSKSFTASDMQSLDKNIKGEFHDEISLARVQASHLAELMKDYKNMPLQDYISASNAINNYLDRIQSLSRAQKYIYQNQTTVEKALEELKDISPDDD
jgi:acyl-[acyl carrier protein]--UDP-N-acetylglucosamine O-acyltransferase